MTNTDEIFHGIMQAGGLMADSAKVFKDASEDIKREFIINFQQQVKEAKKDMIDHFGSDLVEKIENFA